MLKKNKQKGFSTLEMIIAMFIFLIIGIAIVTFQLNLFSLNKISGNNLIAQEDMRQILKTIASEIRSMAPSNMGAYPITEAGTSTLSFYTNTDSDSLQEKVRYFLEDTTLKKGTIKPTGNPLIYNDASETIKELAHDMANGTTSIFYYYDTDYDGTSDPLDQPVDIPLIRLIKVNVIIDNDPIKSPPPLSMTTQVSIRNLKDNL